MAALRILVTGSTGFLGGYVKAAVTAAGHVAATTARRAGDAAVDLGAPGMVDAVVQALRPDLVINLAACARLADCEHDPALAMRVNAAVPGRLAERFGARLLHASTDLVFDGRGAPYAATSPVAPLSTYGLSKAAGEEAAARHGGRVVRLPLLFGADRAGRGATASLRATLAAGRRAALFPNEYRTPLHAADAAAALVDLALDPDGPRLVHLPGPERVSRWELGRRFAAAHGFDLTQLDAVECQDALRPRDVSLAGDWRAGRCLDAMLQDG
ncbi:MAG: sugar nucleotide-binding protein [Planctomycetes bacterium]|nr:sugar nucleotide-binding protein [Planctomycetota bacterium]